MGIAIPQVIAEDRASGAQVIDGSIVFDRSKLKHLKRTISTTGNQKTFTVSFWFKKQLVGNLYQYFFTTEYLGSGSYFEITSNSDQFHVYGGSGVIDVKITRKLRDTDGWIHAVVSIDSTIATPASDRVKIYLNGERQEDYVSGSSDFPPQNYLCNIEGSKDWYIGAAEFSNSIQGYYDGSMSNFYFVDGQALGPEEFGFTDPLTNTWRPKKYDTTAPTNNPNNNTTWSNNVTASSGGFGTGEEVTKGFDGNLATKCKTNTNGADINITFSGISVEKLLRIRTNYTNGSNSAITVNGTNYGAAATASDGEYKVINGFTGPLTSIVLSADSAVNASFSAIEVDGVILQDATTTNNRTWDGSITFGTNGFYLPMDGNSPIGEDKSGNSNINDGTIWSKDVTTSNAYSANRDPGKGFDGNSSLVGKSDTYVQSDNSSGTVTWTPNGYTIDTADEILVKGISSLDRLSVVGSLGSQSNIAPATVNGVTNVYTIPTNLGTLTSLTVTGNSSLAGWSGISVGGILLVNGLKGNSWTPVNFGGGSNTIDKATGALSILNTVSGGKFATVGVRTDAFANNLVLALPLVGVATDVSHLVNSGTTEKVITSYNNAAPADDGQGNFYDTSFYLDGTDDYVETSNSDDFVVGTGDFTIEAWYNVAATQGTNSRLFAQNVNDDNNWDCYLGGSYGTSDIMMHGGSVDLKMSFPTANAWHHFCIARKNGTLYSFMNGVLRHTQTYTNSVGANNHGFRVGVIGGSGGSTGYGLQGYVQDFRFYKGVAKYTSDFIPASTNPDILPDTPSGVSGGSKLTKITDGAVYFDGNGDSLSIADSADFTFGSGDFTMEAFVYCNDASTIAHKSIINKYTTDNASSSWFWSIYSGYQYFYFYHPLLNGSSSVVPAANILFPSKKWTHCAVVRDGNTLKIFQDGIQVDNGGDVTGLTMNDTSVALSIGDDADNNNNYPMDGYISNVRIVKGTALYTSNFTPPTKPLTNVTNTKLLCCQSNTDVTEGAVVPSSSSRSWVPTGYTYWSGMNDNWNNTGTTTSDLSASSTGDWIDTALPSSGKYYFETIVNDPSQYRVVGLGLTASGAGAGYYNDLFGWYWNGTGTPPLFLTTNASGVTKAATGVTHGDTSELTFYDGDILMWAWDADNDRIYFGRNGTWYNNGDPAAGTGHIISGQDLSADNYYLKVGYMNNALVGGNALNLLTLTNVPSSESGSTSIASSREISNFNLVNKATNFNPFNTDINTVRGQETNYPTMNPLAKNSDITLKDGNLRITQTDSHGQKKIVYSNAKIPNGGKWYVEWIMGGGGACTLGIGKNGKVEFRGTDTQIGTDTNSWGYEPQGNLFHNGNLGGSFGSCAAGDVIGMTIDTSGSSLTIQWYKNGVLIRNNSNTPGAQICQFTGISLDEDYVVMMSHHTPQYDTLVNFGQKPFKFPPPDGFQPLNGTNIIPETVIVRPDQYVGVTTYHGDNIVRTQKVGFKPDLVWLKDYSSNSHFHVLCDSVRGGANILSSSNDLNQFNNTGYVQGFESDGFRLGADTHVNGDPGTPYAYVAWAWKAGGEVGVGRSFMIDGVGFSTAGDAGFSPQAIPITGAPNAVEIEPFKASISTKTGFSIVHYKGSDNDEDGILHGLKQKPDLVIVKNMNRIQTSGNENYTQWRVWHSGFGDNRNLKLGNDGAQDKNYWNDGNIYGHTSPDTSMRMVGSSTKFGVNYLNDDYIMYSWHNVPGLQKFGTFVGNTNADGPFIELGFRPAIIWVKRISGAGNDWVVQDSERQKYNPVSDYLVLNQINQTATGLNVDFLSNGFKIRHTNGNMNASSTYMYCAWAEAPSINSYGGQSNAR